MTLSQRAVEAAARAIYEDRNGKGCKPWSLQPKSHKEPYISDARAAISAALSVDGLCLVPNEPTQEMLDAALALDAVSHGVLVPAGPADVWAAMLAAASDGEYSPPQEKI